MGKVEDDRGEKKLGKGNAGELKKEVDRRGERRRFGRDGFEPGSLVQ